MFDQFFAMSHQPFTEKTSTDRLLKDERVNQGLTRLQYFASSPGYIALLTGDTGSGKSSLIRLFLKSLSPGNFTPIYLHTTDLKATSLLKILVSKLGDHPRNTKGLIFTQIFQIAQQSKTTLLLVVDEAHLLCSQSLTDLRLLVSSALEDLPIKILLVGQPDLRSLLKTPQLADLKHRISIQFHLHSLQKSQTHAYIDHHLQNAGANPNLFDSQVKDLIHDFTGGLPRQINNIATACLLQSYFLKNRRVDHNVFNLASNDCQL